MPLELSNRYKMIAGVCGGLAEWLGWDVTVVRVVYVLVSVFSAAFPGIVVYLILWALMPRANDTATTEIYTLSLHDFPISVVAVSLDRRATSEPSHLYIVCRILLEKKHTD